MRAMTTVLLGALLASCARDTHTPQAVGVASATAPGYWVTGVASNAAGERAFKLWVPAGYAGAQALPLVMMLHGCTQNPDDFAAGTRMNEVADREKFFVVYPDQPRSANASKCWNWFEVQHQQRGSGEPSVLVEVVRSISAPFNVKSNRVFVARLSAGGAMATVLGATYPDVFAAVGVGAGLEYQAGTDLASALSAQLMGGPDPDGQGRAAYAAMGSAVSRVPVIVFHGTADTTVAPVNAHQVMAQWAQTNDLADDGADNDTVSVTAALDEAGQVPGGREFVRSTVRDATGRTLLEKWMVQGMRHAWSGGSSNGSYTDPLGPDAARETWRFFTQWTRDD